MPRALVYSLLAVAFGFVSAGFTNLVSSTQSVLLHLAGVGVALTALTVNRKNQRSLKR